MSTRTAKRSERAQSLVELAISLTVMLLLLSGAVTFGMGLFSYVAIRDAASEGTLFGSISPFVDGSNGHPLDTKYEAGEDPNWQGICDRVKASSTSPVNMTGFTCSHDGATSHASNNIDVIATTGNPCEGNTSGVANGIRVMVDYYYPIIMPYVGAIVGSQQVHLRAMVTNTILSPSCP
jgi:hypothetical protein